MQWEKSGVGVKNYKIVTMIIRCASVLEKPRRGTSNTLPYDLSLEPRS